MLLPVGEHSTHMQEHISESTVSPHCLTSALSMSHAGGGPVEDHKLHRAVSR